MKKEIDWEKVEYFEALSCELDPEANAAEIEDSFWAVLGKEIKHEKVQRP